MGGSLIKYLVQGFQGPGGIFMWGILIIAMIGLAIACERAYYLLLKCGTGRGKFMADLLKIIKTGDYQKAIRYAAGHESPLAKVIMVILQSKEKGEKAVNRAVDEVFLTETPRIQRYTPLLVVVANVATLVGLLGTIFGLILAFDAVANVPAAQRAQALATGISVAMATTAWGLTVAIPCLFVNGILSTQTERIIEEMDEKSTKMVNIITEGM
jgi:biopolymer transport protein ExbB/TolQ